MIKMARVQQRPKKCVDLAALKTLGLRCPQAAQALLVCALVLSFHASRLLLI
jgi:hypothetical protein